MLNRYPDEPQHAGLAPLIPLATTADQPRTLDNRRAGRRALLKTLATLICLLSVWLLLLAAPRAGAQTLPLPTHAAGFFVQGMVSAVAVDTSGRFYIGSDFHFVNGVPRNHIARFNADGSLDITWNPNADNWVGPLAVAGNTVYVGGGFTTIGGQARNNIAALDTGTGTATPWNPNPDGYGVRALAVAGETVYAGGYFTSIGGQARNGIAALDASAGAATAWNPNADVNDPSDPDAIPAVSTLAVAGETVYAAGYFTSIGGRVRQGLAALDASTGAATAWNPKPDGGVSDLAISGNTVYVAGDFTIIGRRTRHGLAALDARTGAATRWNPKADNTVAVLAVLGNTVYVAGGFTTIGGQARNGIAALDTVTGTATAWNPNAATTYSYVSGLGKVSALAVSDNTVYVGGYFSSMEGATHLSAAAIATTGEVSTTPYDAQFPGIVRTVAVDDSERVIVGGEFTQAGSLGRSGIARFNADGILDINWNPEVVFDSSGRGISALAISGNTVYVAGGFTSIGGQARHGLAALDASTGDATPWDPNPDGYFSVLDLAVAGNTVYAVGDFTSIGGQARNGIAALDAGTGAATAWNPNPDGYFSVLALAVAGNTVYVGGRFVAIGGQARRYLAALDTNTGTATPWDPNPDGVVSALIPSGNTVYAGGYFTSIGGQVRHYLAALDAGTGTATAWNPNPEAAVVSTLAPQATRSMRPGDTLSLSAGRHAMVLPHSTPAPGLPPLGIRILVGSIIHNSIGPPSYIVNALALSGDTVYVGGMFTLINNVPRFGFVALPADATPSLSATTLSSTFNPTAFRLRRSRPQ